MIDDNVQYVNVTSSNVYAIGYDPEGQNLFVIFQDPTGGPGRKYAYYHVMPDVWAAFQAAPSKGKFVWAHLRDKYSYNELQT